MKESIKNKIISHLAITKNILNNLDIISNLHHICSTDNFFSKISQINFFSTFSEKLPIRTSLYFIAYLNTSKFISHPSISNLVGKINFSTSCRGFIITLFILFSDQYCNPITAEEIYDRYDYLEHTSNYKRELDNTQAGLINIYGQRIFTLPYSMEIIDMINLCKENFLKMHKFLLVKE